MLLVGGDQKGLLQIIVIKGNIAIRGCETIFNFHSMYYYEKRPLFVNGLFLRVYQDPFGLFPINSDSIPACMALPL